MSNEGRMDVAPSTTRIPIGPRWLRGSIQSMTVVSPSSPPTSRRGLRTVSRRAVIAGIVAFLSLQAGLNLAIQQEWIPVRDPVYAEKRDFLTQHPAFFGSTGSSAPLRLMALGSSRTQLAFDARRFSEATGAELGRPVESFNFGCPAAGPLTSSLYLQRLLEAGLTTDYLIVEIHTGFIARQPIPFESRWLHAYRLRPEELTQLRGYGWEIADPPHHGWKGWLSAAYAYRMGLTNHYAPVMLPCPYGLTVGVRSDPWGYVAGFDPPRSDYPRAIQRSFQEYAPALADYHVGGAGCEAIRNMLTRAQAQGIRTAVVLMPESTEFRSWYGAEGTAEIDAFAQRLGQDFGIPVFDARTWVPDRGFADGHHLTEAGAQTYTDQLSKAVIPWLRSGGAQGWATGGAR